MNNKMIKTVMSVMLLLAVYISACVYLPKVRAVEGENVSAEDVLNINLADKVVVIDSGHGGIDPGKASSTGLLEKNINLAIAKVLQQKLKDTGINVVMTREDDEGLYSEDDGNKKIADMKKRCSIIAESNADIVISVHQNSFQSSSVKGAQMFYYKHSVQGKRLAQILQKSFKQNVDSENERVEKADSTYYMLLHTASPTVIAECGFLSNPQEAELLNTPEYQEKVAQALYLGIIEYFTGE